MVLLLPVCLPGSPSTSSVLVGASAGAEGKTKEWDPCLSHLPVSLDLIRTEVPVVQPLCWEDISNRRVCCISTPQAEREQPRDEYVLKETLCFSCCFHLAWHPCPQGAGWGQTSGASVLISLSCHLGVWVAVPVRRFCFPCSWLFLALPLCCQSSHRSAAGPVQWVVLSAGSVLV